MRARWKNASVRSKASRALAGVGTSPRSSPGSTNGELVNTAWKKRSGVLAARSTSMYWQLGRPEPIDQRVQQRGAAGAAAAEHDRHARRRGVERGEDAALQAGVRRHHDAALLHRQAHAARRGPWPALPG